MRQTLASLHERIIVEADFLYEKTKDLLKKHGGVIHFPCAGDGPKAYVRKDDDNEIVISELFIQEVRLDGNGDIMLFCVAEKGIYSDCDALTMLCDHTSYKELHSYVYADWVMLDDCMQGLPLPTLMSLVEELREMEL